jgi:hypothetical protein
MAPLEVFLIALLFFLVVGGIGWVSHSLEKRSSLKKVRKQGSKNLRVHEVQAELLCCICEQKLNPSEDGSIFYQDRWWCLPHWEYATDINDAVKEIKKEV